MKQAFLGVPFYQKQFSNPLLTYLATVFASTNKKKVNKAFLLALDHITDKTGDFTTIPYQLNLS